MSDLKEVQGLRPFTKFCMTIGNLPSSYLVSMTYEEQLLWLCDYLQNTVIPTVNNNAEAVEELQNLYIQLKDYVDHYFDNLDVQNEINNKLDDMAENGELQEIIGSYLSIKSLLTFDDISKMKSSSNIINGSYAKTLGFNNINDGGSQIYKIIQEENAENVDNMTKINLGHDNLYAISLNDSINVKKYGAVGDGINDDTTIIQILIDKFPHRTLFFPEGNYLISSPLNIKSGNEYQVNLKFNKNARLFTNTQIDELISIGKTLAGTWARNSIGNIVTIEGGIFDASNTKRAIYLTADRKQTRLLNLNIINVKEYGIYVDRNLSSTSISSDALLDTISITGNGDYTLNNYGIYLYGTDNELNNIRITSIKYPIDINGGGNLFNNVHLTCAYQNITTEMINNSIGTIIRGFGINYFNNYYVDTFGICFDLRSPMFSYFNNCEVYYYQADENSNYIVFNYQTRAYIYCNNCHFEMPASSSSNKITNFTTDVEYDARKYPALKKLAVFTNTNYANVNNNIDLIKEISLNHNYMQTLNSNVNPWTITMSQNAWYPLLLLSAGYHKFTIQLSNDQISEVEIYVSETAPKINVKDIYHTTGGHYQKYNIALANGFKDNTDNYFAYLLVQATDVDSSFNVTLSNIINTWATLKYSAVSTTPISNPTIITQVNLLPTE